MVVGSTLMMLGGAPYFSPAFGRGGLSAVFSCEALQFSGPGVTLLVTVEHKNNEDLLFVPLGAFPPILAVGVTPLALTGIKEQVRFTYTVAGAVPTDAAHFAMLAPAWRPY